jgi:hypothetical protein
MITYSARTIDGETITVQCPSLGTALDLAEADLLNGMTPVLLDIDGILANVTNILLLLYRRWEQRRTAREVGVHEG